MASVCAGLEGVLEDGDFTASVDIATAADDQEFTLTVDWELIAEVRVTVSFEHAD